MGTTFEDALQHAEWVYLGSQGWQDEVGDTYPDGRPVGGGGMPAWGDTLTPEELMSVVVYERTEFGGLDPVEEGLIDEEGNLLVEYDAEANEFVDAPVG